MRPRVRAERKKKGGICRTDHLRRPRVVAVVVRRQIRVVELSHTEGEVAMGFEDLREGLPLVTDTLLAEVVGERVGARDVRAAPSHEAVARRPTEGDLHVGAVENQALLRELVEVGREHPVGAVVSELRAKVVCERQRVASNLNSKEIMATTRLRCAWR